MSIVQPFITLPEGAWFHQTSDKQHPLGTIGVAEDGRTYRYFRAGAANIVTGALCQMAVPGANFDELAVPTATTVGQKEVSVTNGATTLVADELADGYLNVEDDTGEGYLYKIEGNDAESAGSANFNIRLKSGLVVAWTTSTTVGIWKNPYSAVIIHPSPATAKLLGVTCRAMTANYYGWLQTKGPASVITEGTVVINERVVDSATADGAVAPMALTEGTPNTAAGQFTLGTVIEVAATTEESFVWLDID